MKITELRCSACDGTLKIDEQDPNYAVCEYCHSRYMIEWERPAGRQGALEGEAHLKPLGETKTPRIEYQPVKETKTKRTGWEYDGWKRLLTCFIALVLIMAVWQGPAVLKRYRMDHPGTGGTSAELGEMAEEIKKANSAGSGLVTGSSEVSGEGLTGIWADFAEIVFGKAADELTEGELEKIAWIETRTTIDNREIGYSFENPLDNPDAELTWVAFSRDDYSSISASGLRSFPGLKVIGTNGMSVKAEDLNGLAIEGLKGYYSSLAEAASVVEQPELLRMVDMTGSPSSLKGLEQMPNLESLSINADTIEEERSFVNASGLKSVYLDMYNGTMDFTVFGVMPWLESLTIQSQNLRDISFVSKITSLKSLGLKYGEMLTLAPLSGMTGLEELSVESCDELRDLTAIESLSGLKKLTLELPYDCPPPDMSGLAAMEELYLDGFDETGFLKGMPNLEKLTLESCSVDTPSDFEGLSHLKTLVCSSFGYMERDYSFVTSLPALETVDLHGTITYGDLSGIFNMPTVRSVNLSGMQCGLEFDKIAENTTLEELFIDHMTLYTNVQVSGGGGIYSVNWDDVPLKEHLDFLKKFKGLKRLSICENELTDLSFAAELSGLEAIDFSDNYVSDLSPLSGLRALRQVKCTDNPVANYEMLGDSVKILR